MRLARTYAMSPVNIAVANLKVDQSLIVENYIIHRLHNTWLVEKDDAVVIRDFQTWWEVWDFLPKGLKF